VPALLAETTTTTTEVPQIVGKYPGDLPVLGSAGLLLVVIVAAGGYLTHRSRRANVDDDDRRAGPGRPTDDGADASRRSGTAPEAGGG
jgi:hypothetical protein